MTYQRRNELVLRHSHINLNTLEGSTKVKTRKALLTLLSGLTLAGLALTQLTEEDAVDAVRDRQAIFKKGPILLGLYDAALIRNWRFSRLTSSEGKFFQ